MHIIRHAPNQRLRKILMSFSKISFTDNTKNIFPPDLKIRTLLSMHPTLKTSALINQFKHFRKLTLQNKLIDYCSMNSLNNLPESLKEIWGIWKYHVRNRKV